MIPEGCSNDALVMPRSPAQCQTCGAELGDTAEWFSGGDRCLRVFGLTRARSEGHKDVSRCVDSDRRPVDLRVLVLPGFSELSSL